MLCIVVSLQHSCVLKWLKRTGYPVHSSKQSPGVEINESACRVSAEYTHSDWNDIHVQFAALIVPLPRLTRWPKRWMKLVQHKSYRLKVKHESHARPSRSQSPSLRTISTLCLSKSPHSCEFRNFFFSYFLHTCNQQHFTFHRQQKKIFLNVLQVTQNIENKTVDVVITFQFPSVVL